MVKGQIHLCIKIAKVRKRAVLVMWSCVRQNLYRRHIAMKWTPDTFSKRPLLWKRSKHPCFYIFPIEFGGSGDIHKHQNSRTSCWNRNDFLMKMPVCTRFHIHIKHAYKFHPKWVCKVYLLCKPFYINFISSGDGAAWKKIGCPPVYAANLVANSGNASYGFFFIIHWLYYQV